jgi:hypothetical protein
MEETVAVDDVMVPNKYADITTLVVGTGGVLPPPPPQAVNKNTIKLDVTMCIIFFFMKKFLRIFSDSPHLIGSEVGTV